ncbi:unnamed protein product, partial [Rotaria sp. Silwood2]
MGTRMKSKKSNDNGISNTFSTQSPAQVLPLSSLSSQQTTTALTLTGLSKHYYKDEHFVPLMEQNANEIINRVRQTIDIRTLLSSYTLNEAKNICYQA